MAQEETELPRGLRQGSVGVYNVRFMQVGIHIVYIFEILDFFLQLSYEIIVKLSIIICSENFISYLNLYRLVDCSLDLLAATCTNEELFEISQPDYLTVDMMKEVKNDLKC